MRDGDSVILIIPRSGTLHPGGCFCAKFRKIFGGEFQSLGRMMERARREAALRMIEEAAKLGATAVCNVRYETSTISGSKPGSISGSEVIAYGTALIPPPRP